MDALTDGPEHQTHTKNLRQVGWLGHCCSHFYPWGATQEEIKSHEHGGFSPVYVEVED